MAWSGMQGIHQVAKVEDATGQPVLSVRGLHYNGRDETLVRREETGETLRFPVFAYGNSSATMQALGNYDRLVMQFRLLGNSSTLRRQIGGGECEVLVASDVDVTNEIILIAIVASSFLPAFFRSPQA
jgi:hypothetical protein